jgi:hypothetical protein
MACPASHQRRGVDSGSPRAMSALARHSLESGQSAYGQLPPFVSACGRVRIGRRSGHSGVGPVNVRLLAMSQSPQLAANWTCGRPDLKRSAAHPFSAIGARSERVRFGASARRHQAAAMGRIPNISGAPGEAVGTPPSKACERSERSLTTDCVYDRSGPPFLPRNLGSDKR